MAKKKEEKPKDDVENQAEEIEILDGIVGKNIIEEEKEQEAAEKEQDYNSIFDDEYVEQEKKEEAEDEEEEAPDEEVIEEEESSKSNDSSSDSSSDKKNKKNKSDSSKKEDKKEKESDKGENEDVAPVKPVKEKKDKKGFSKKKILTILAAILLLLVGAFLGWKLFTMRNEIKEVKEETAPTMTKPEVKESKVVYVTADNGLNMRESADSASKSLAIIPNGTKLTVLEEKDGWYKVEYNGQTGWVSKDFVTEAKPDDMKTYTGTGFSPDAPKFSIQYPSDWTLNDYKISKTDGGKTYKIALGEGGHGFSQDDPTITSTNEDVTYNGLPAKKTTVKKSGNITLIVVNFTKGNDYTNIEFTVPDGYDQSYIDTFDKMLATFKYL